jgi:uncharacterized protein YbjT (DUF2867 family)
MKVLVTGGTGFVGSHTVKAIVDAGHDLRLLVRSPDRLASALEPLGMRDVEHRTDATPSFMPPRSSRMTRVKPALCSG